MRAVKLYKSKNGSDQIAMNSYVLWAVTKIASDNATPQARQVTSGEK